MPGVIVHLILAIICLVIVHFIHFKWEYSLAIFVGNFIPDIIKYGFTAIRLSTLSLNNITADSAYHYLNQVTMSYANWFTWGFFMIGLTLLLYHFHAVKRKTMEEYDEIYVFLLLGIFVHIIIDTMIPVHGIWF